MKVGIHLSWNQEGEIKNAIAVPLDDPAFDFLIGYHKKKQHPLWIAESDAKRFDLEIDSVPVQEKKEETPQVESNSNDEILAELEKLRKQNAELSKKLESQKKDDSEDKKEGAAKSEAAPKPAAKKTTSRRGRPKSKAESDAQK